VGDPVDLDAIEKALTTLVVAVRLLREAQARRMELEAQDQADHEAALRFRRARMNEGVDDD